ncbi:MAG TPA: SDR family NAD(P)-dependent oxidoreductase [Vicinamibacteria bacterium]|jgi:3-oxoacyl-[acyl-carrier protein] reductase
MDLTGRAALVTGGGRGIGRAVSLLLARLGAPVALSYARDGAAAADTVRAIEAEGGAAVALEADLGRPGAADALVDEASRRVGPLRILVVNHGIWKRAPLLGMTDAEWRETLAVNLDGAFAVSRAAARGMAAGRSGAIVLVSSTAGQRGEADHSHYAASKGALLAFTRSLAAELAPHGVRVNAVAPGWVLTDMTRAALAGAGGAAAVARIPLGRAGTPEEIAGPVAFLCSDLASYVYGTVLCVNGGAVMAD